MESTHRHQTHEVARIEGLSDAVFAFAVTLLVVSLEVPRTFSELLETMHGFGAFALSFCMLFMIWNEQHTYFRRYGLQSAFSLWMNGTLLFFVLFYVYPLKFVFTYVLSVFTGGRGLVKLPHGEVVAMVESRESALMMIIYGLGFMAVFTIFLLLYWHVWRNRERLGLDAAGKLAARIKIEENGIMLAIGALSVAIAAIGGPRASGWAGFSYFLIGICRGIHGSVRGRQVRRLRAAATATL